MQKHIATTPFGRRSMTLGSIARQVTARKMPAGVQVNKWQVFQHIREARDLLGATDRALAILNALLSFHRETELSADGALIVWPSNEQLMARANGISAATLRRHLAVLVDCGLIIRKDSPNGKRFARRGRAGEIEQAYGFDLAPLVARAEEFSQLAEAVQAEKKAFRVAKERLTLLRRDIVKMIDAAVKEKVPGNWGRVLQSYQTIIMRLPRLAPRQVVDDICADLLTLHVEIREALESFAKSQNLNAYESQSERHIQTPHRDSISESKSDGNDGEANGEAAENDNTSSLPKRDLSLGIVLNACPDIRDVAPQREIRHWRDLLSAAETVQRMLGVSPSAWAEACETMGQQQAAITMAAIYQRADRIGSHGGYLRRLTDRARQGKFSIWPMITALIKAKHAEGQRPAGMDKTSIEQEVMADPGPFEVSPSLLRALQNRKGRH